MLLIACHLLYLQKVALKSLEIFKLETKGISENYISRLSDFFCFQLYDARERLGFDLDSEVKLSEELVG